MTDRRTSSRAQDARVRLCRRTRLGISRFSPFWYAGIPSFRGHNGKSLALQGLCYGLFMVLIGAFADSPAYDPLPDDSAVIKLSLRHAGQLLGECRTRSEEELAALPPNMRAPTVCPRGRSPLLVELVLDGELRLSRRVEPSGWHNDGAVSLYERLAVPAGELRVEIRMKEHIDATEFHYRLEKPVTLEPARVLAIDFKSPEKGFEFL